MSLQKYFKDVFELESKIKMMEGVNGVEKMTQLKRTMYIQSDYHKRVGKIFTSDILRNYKKNKNIDRTYSINTKFFINTSIYDPYSVDTEGFYPYHGHDYLEMIYVMSGQFRHLINGIEHVIHEGELCILNTKNIHKEQLKADKDFVLFVCIKPEVLRDWLKEEVNLNKSITQFLEQTCDMKNESKEYIYFEKMRQPVDRALMTQVVKEYFEQLPGSEDFIRGAFKRLFYEISKSYKVHYICEKREVVENRLFLEMDHYVRENIATVNRTDLGDKFYFNPCHINHIIKKNTNKTFSQYLIDLKFDTTLKLLQQGQTSIDEIIRTVGYANKSYFYKVFVERYGVTPKEYRDNMNKKTIN